MDKLIGCAASIEMVDDGDIVDRDDYFDTQIGSERERAFLEAEMSVFSEDKFTEY